MNGDWTRASGAMSQLAFWCQTCFIASGLILLSPMQFGAAVAEPEGFSILICGSDGCFDPIDGSMPGSEPLRTYSILFSKDTQVCSSLANSLNSAIRDKLSKLSRHHLGRDATHQHSNTSIFAGGNFIPWHSFTAWHPDEITSILAAGRYRGDDAEQVLWTIVSYFNDRRPIVVTRGGDWSSYVVSWLPGTGSIDASDWSNDLSYTGLVSPGATGFGRCDLYRGEPLERANLFRIVTPSCLKDEALRKAVADVGLKPVKTMIFFLRAHQKILVVYAAGQFDSVYVAELNRSSIEDVCLLKSDARIIVNYP